MHDIPELDVGGARFAIHFETIGKDDISPTEGARHIATRVVSATVIDDPAHPKTKGRTFEIGRYGYADQYLISGESVGDDVLFTARFSWNSR